MRSAFIRTLTEMAGSDEKIVLITADMGFSVFEDFASKLPERFYNVGIAEATMIGFAAGLAMQGYRPFVYSISPFATMRCFEQIRVDVCYQNLPVTIVGVGGGLSYGALGSTHHAIEDIGIMRVLPNMTVYAPADPKEAQLSVITALQGQSPAYIRLARNNEPNIHTSILNFTDGFIQIRMGQDLAVVSHGPIVNEVLKAVDAISSEEPAISVFSVPIIKPLNTPFMQQILRDYKRVLVVEEHNITGGLYSAIAEIAVTQFSAGCCARVQPIGIPGRYPDVYGGHSFLLQHFGLDAESLREQLATVRKEIQGEA